MWGSRQFYVDGIEAFGRWDNLAVFIDKRTGAVRKEFFTPNFTKIRQMPRSLRPAEARRGTEASGGSRRSVTS